MLKLRPYKPADAQMIISWCEDKDSFIKWTAGQYGKYPITPDDMNNKYAELNRLISNGFFPMVAYDGDAPVGHIVIRYMDDSKKTVRLGFVIVDGKLRGKGYGKQLIRLALQYAHDTLGAAKVTIGVYDNNMPAYACYISSGFHVSETTQPQIHTFSGEVWKYLELEI